MNNNYLIHTLTLGVFETNCYIFECLSSKKSIIIDPGAEAHIILDYIDKHKLEINKIFLTHAHIDHIGALAEVKQKFSNAPIYMHKDELQLYHNFEVQSQMLGISNNIKKLPSIDIFINEGDIFELGLFKFKSLLTAGHSPASISFSLEQEKIVFAGDTLFFRSIGRTDLPGGNHQQLLQSIKSQLLTLNPNTIIYPGHGPKTDIKSEQAYNQFLQN